MITTTKIDDMTLAEYVRLYEQDGAFEIIDGERKSLMPPVALHGLIVRTLFFIIYTFCKKHDLGEVLQEMPFVLTYNSDWVKGSRVPDIMFFAKDRWETYIQQTADWVSKPFIMVPDFVIEVVSPNDLYTKLQQKVEVYEHDGVRLIWIVDPMRKKVSVYSGESFVSLGAEDTLTGGAVLPDLQINLKDLFAVIATPAE
jgi:Uma2 family endonuclease